MYVKEILNSNSSSCRTRSDAAITPRNFREGFEAVNKKDIVSRRHGDDAETDERAVRWHGVIVNVLAFGRCYRSRTGNSAKRGRKCQRQHAVYMS